MLRYLLLLLILGGLLIVFSIQNTGTVVIQVLLWEVNVSLPLLVGISLLLGALVGAFGSLVPLQRKKRKNKLNSPSSL